MASFDVVSRVDFQEIDNAIANALREITNRYDFKGSNTTLERSEKVITIVTDDDLKLSQVNDILISHFVRRKLDASKSILVRLTSSSSFNPFFIFISEILFNVASKEDP